MKKIFMAIAAIAAAILFISCDKGENGSSIDKELIGNWEGYRYTAYIGGKPVGDPVVVTFSFTESRFVWKQAGETKVDSPYVCGVNGNKYFQWTEGEKAGGDAIFYSISGNTMTITGANGSIIAILPETMTRK